MDPKSKYLILAYVQFFQPPELSRNFENLSKNNTYCSYFKTIYIAIITQKNPKLDLMQKIYTHSKLLYLYMYNFYDLNIIFGYTTTPVFWQYVYKITISTVAIFLIRKKEIISTITFQIAIIDFFAIRKQLVTISQKRPDNISMYINKVGSHCLP